MMQTMKSIEMHATSPDLLVARAEQLDLSEEQQKKLRDISKRAREQAQQVLNDGQRKKLEEGKSGPLTPMELVKLVAKERKQGTRSAENKMMCPMCKKMMNKKMANKEGHDE